MGTITNEQLNPLLEAVKSGVGLGGCHGGMCDSFRAATEYHFMTGGQWVAHPGNDGVEYQVDVTDPDHFITCKSPASFGIKSEQYYMHVDPAIRVLATTRFPVADGPHLKKRRVRYAGRLDKILRAGPACFIRRWDITPTLSRSPRPSKSPRAVCFGRPGRKTPHRLAVVSPWDVPLDPIPFIVEPPNWGRLPISECDEPLVPLAPSDALRVRPLYFEIGLPGASDVLWVRAGVAERLERAARSLAEGIALVVFDGYRPLSIQQALYDSFTAEIKEKRPDLDADALRQYVGQFVATPTADPRKPPPHRTGGAVDVYLQWAENGQMLPMGTLPDEVADETPTRFYEDTSDGRALRQNRRVLYHAMTNAGFTNYSGEWWHYDFGNQRWANIAHQSAAIYGIPPKEG